MNDLDEKAIFFTRILEAIEEVGYTAPNFYVDDYCGEPFIYDDKDNPVQSLAGDSPVGVLRDFVKLLDRINY